MRAFRSLAGLSRPGLMGLALLLGALACTCNCGGLNGLGQLINNAQELSGTVQAAATEYGPTLEAQATAFGPTFDAEMTRILEAATLEGPAYEGTATAVVATLDALLGESSSDNSFTDDLDAARSTMDAAIDQMDAPQAATLTPSASGDSPALPPATPPASSPGEPLVYGIAIGETATATVDTAPAAHTWLFTGSAGQTVALRLTGSITGNPVVSIEGPDGSVLAAGEDSDSGYDISLGLTATLPSDGTYTIRIEMDGTGEYELSLSE
jgi:hypothetical protein